MDVVNKRCAGLDVHKKTVVACVRAPGLDRRRRPMPRHLNHKLTVERANDRRRAIFLPVQRRFLSRRILFTCHLASRVGLTCGREDRSLRPASPSASQRPIHLYTVCRLTPSARPTSAGAWPSSSTRRTSRARPAGVSFAF